MSKFTFKLSLTVLAICMIVIAPAVAQKRTPQKRTPSSQAEINLSFAPLVKKAAPAVVNIFTRKTVTTRRFSPLFDDPFFKRFFGEDFGGGRGNSRKRVQNSLGSGVIIKSDGLIVTNVDGWPAPVVEVPYSVAPTHSSAVIAGIPLPPTSISPSTGSMVTMTPLPPPAPP